MEVVKKDTGKKYAMKVIKKAAYKGDDLYK